MDVNLLWLSPVAKKTQRPLDSASGFIECTLSFNLDVRSVLDLVH